MPPPLMFGSSNVGRYPIGSRKSESPGWLVAAGLLSAQPSASATSPQTLSKQQSSELRRVVMLKLREPLFNQNLSVAGRGEQARRLNKCAIPQLSIAYSTL